ncbi:MAG: hypothetical protein Ct9H300mP15_30480 [Gemmatimonadota bacterium]|nr:MAG: hypothetical protein Ct9H300mP15_30480 [Gemmatimonadota bacterium]
MGGGYESAVPILQALSVLVPIMVWARYLASNGLSPGGLSFLFPGLVCWEGLELVLLFSGPGSEVWEWPGRCTAEALVAMV